MGLPDGATVEVVIAGVVVAEAAVAGGRMELDVTSDERPIPAVRDGDVIELRADGAVQLRGTYRPD